MLYKFVLDNSASHNDVPVTSFIIEFSSVLDTHISNRSFSSGIYNTLKLVTISHDKFLFPSINLSIVKEVSLAAL